MKDFKDILKKIKTLDKERRVKALLKFQLIVGAQRGFIDLKKDNLTDLIDELAALVSGESQPENKPPLSEYEAITEDGTIVNLTK